MKNALLAALLICGVGLLFKTYSLIVIRAIRKRVSKKHWTIAVGFALISIVVVTAYIDAPRPPRPPENLSVLVDEQIAVELLPFNDDPMAAWAETWSAVFLTFADLIESDGRTSKPLIRRVDDVRRIRDNIVDVPISGIPGGDVIGAAVAPTLDELNVGELTPSKRQRVVDLFREVANILGAK